MVVGALSSSCGAHASIMITIGHRTIPTVDGLDSGSQAVENGENSRRKLQNVVANSTAEFFDPTGSMVSRTLILSRSISAWSS